MQRIIPNVWCDGTAAAAGEFYASVFPAATSQVTARYPTEGLPDFQQSMAGQELIVDVTIGGYVIRLINAGSEFSPGPALSFVTAIDPNHFGGDGPSRALIDRMWAALADGGEVRMPLDAYPYSPYYGWVEDRYGVNWQLMLSESAAEGQPLVIPQFLFTGATPRAAEALGAYTDLFPDSAIGLSVPGADGTSVAFAHFTLAGQWFSAMDGGTDHHFTFTPGVSLQVDCADQAEIDRLWEALSAVPEAEQCGWLVDRFGVSWQIVPANMETLMQRPNAYQHMLAMKKMIIDDF